MKQLSLAWLLAGAITVVLLQHSGRGLKSLENIVIRDEASGLVLSVGGFADRPRTREGLVLGFNELGGLKIERSGRPGPEAEGASTGVGRHRMQGLFVESSRGDLQLTVTNDSEGAFLPGLTVRGWSGRGPDVRLGYHEQGWELRCGGPAQYVQMRSSLPRGELLAGLISVPVDTVMSAGLGEGAMQGLFTMYGRSVHLAAGKMPGGVYSIAVLGPGVGMNPLVALGSESRSHGLDLYAEVGAEVDAFLLERDGRLRFAARDARNGVWKVLFDEK